MGYKDVTAGTKIAKLLGSRFIESKNGTGGVELCFSFIEKSTETEEKLFWRGWLSEKAIDSTMKTLVEVMKFNGNIEINENGEFKDPNAFTKEEVSIVVEMQNRKEEDGETDKLDKGGNVIQDAVIKWLNKLGGSHYAGMTSQKVTSMLKSSGFKAAFLSAQKQAGAPSTSPATTKKDPPPVDDGEVPW